MLKDMTIREATEKWVNEFNYYPQSLLERAYPDMVGLEEITPVPVKYECDTCNEEFSEEEYNEAQENSQGFKICPTCFEKEKKEFESEEYNKGEEYTVEDCESYILEEEDYDSMDYGLPMWGTLFNPKERLDEDWIRENLRVVADCGFRIYESEEIGILLGIDGAGYDFYTYRWIPLYKARCLRWHSVN